VVGRPRSLAGLALPVGSALEDAVCDLPRSTLHLLRQTALARPIALIRAGSELADRTLAAAVRLAGEQRPELDVVLIDDATVPARAQADVAGRLKQLGARARVRVISTPSVDDVSGALAAADGDILVASADIPLFRGREGVPRLMDRTGLPVMIVRG
jgi:hypothetical protein